MVSVAILSKISCRAHHIIESDTQSPFMAHLQLTTYVDERVHDGHGLGRDTGIWVHLFQHLVDIDLVGLSLQQDGHNNKCEVSPWVPSTLPGSTASAIQQHIQHRIFGKYTFEEVFLRAPLFSATFLAVCKQHERGFQQHRQ